MMIFQLLTKNKNSETIILLLTSMTDEYDNLTCQQTDNHSHSCGCLKFLKDLNFFSFIIMGVLFIFYMGLER